MVTILQYLSLIFNKRCSTSSGVNELSQASRNLVYCKKRFNVLDSTSIADVTGLRWHFLMLIRSTLTSWIQYCLSKWVIWLYMFCNEPVWFLTKPPDWITIYKALVFLWKDNYSIWLDRSAGYNSKFPKPVFS